MLMGYTVRPLTTPCTFASTCVMAASPLGLAVPAFAEEKEGDDAR